MKANSILLVCTSGLLRAVLQPSCVRSTLSSRGGLIALVGSEVTAEFSWMSAKCGVLDYEA